MKTGIELITKERQEQIEKHGFVREHDLKHNNQDLSYNAAILSNPHVSFYPRKDIANQIIFDKGELFSGWRLPSLAYRGNVIIDNITLSKKERIKQLTVAGALIAAEIDRLNCVESNPS